MISITDKQIQAGIDRPNPHQEAMRLSLSLEEASLDIDRLSQLITRVHVFPESSYEDHCWLYHLVEGLKQGVSELDGILCEKEFFTEEVFV